MLGGLIAALIYTLAAFMGALCTAIMVERMNKTG